MTKRKANPQKAGRPRGARNKPKAPKPAPVGGQSPALKVLRIDAPPGLKPLPPVLRTDPAFTPDGPLPNTNPGAVYDEPDEPDGFDPTRAALSLAETALTHVSADLEDARAERNGFVKADVTKLTTAFGVALDRVIKLRGELAPAETNLLKAPQWHRLRDAILAALKPHPAALDAVVEALRTNE